MSISNITVPNPINLFCNNLTINNELDTNTLTVNNILATTDIVSGTMTTNDLTVGNTLNVIGQNLNVLESDNIQIQSANDINLIGDVNIGTLGTTFELNLNGIPINIGNNVTTASGNFPCTWAFDGVGLIYTPSSLDWMTITVGNVTQVSIKINNFSTALNSTINGNFAYIQETLPNNLLPTGIIGFPVPTYCEENGDFMGCLYFGNPFTNTDDNVVRVWLNTLNYLDVFEGANGAPINGMRSGVCWSINYLIIN